MSNLWSPCKSTKTILSFPAFKTLVCGICVNMCKFVNVHMIKSIDISIVCEPISKSLWMLPLWSHLLEYKVVYKFFKMWFFFMICAKSWQVNEQIKSLTKAVKYMDVESIPQIKLTKMAKIWFHVDIVVCHIKSKTRF